MSLPLRFCSPPDNPIADLALTVVRDGRGGMGQGVAPIQLAGLRDRVILLFVLGIDCGTCKHVAHQLSTLHAEYGDDVAVVGVCVQNGCEERFEEFDPRSEFSFPLAQCSTRDLCAALGVPKGTWLFFPTMIFIDPAQRLRGLFVGGDTFFEDFASNTREALDSLLFKGESVDPQLEVNA